MSNFNPAPNFNILSYANTWGDLIATTNKLVQQNNDIASNNFTKSTGTIRLTDPTLGLQVNANSVFTGQLQAVGTGSSVLIDNNLTVRYGQVYFSNTILGLTNAGQANINGPLLVNGPNTGLFVANTANVYGKLNVSDNATFGNTVIIRGLTGIANNLVVDANTTSNKVYANVSVATTTVVASGTGYFDTVQANTLLTVPGAVVSGTTITNILQANSTVNTSTLSVTGKGMLDVVQANTLVNTTTLSVTGKGMLDVVQANTLVNTATLSVTGKGLLNVVQANTLVNTTTLSVTGATYTNTLQANTSINTVSLTTTGTGNITTVNTASLFVAGTSYTNILQANTSIFVPSITVTSSLDANSVTAYFGSVQTTGQLQVGGNFVITGTTVYTSNAFTLNAGNSTGTTSYYVVARGNSGANASIRWNEINKYWDINDVVSNSYFRILTTQLLSDSTGLSSSSNVASSLAVYNLNTALSANIAILNTNINTNVATINSSISSNAVYTQAAYNQANTASSNTVYLQGALNQTNTNITTANTQLKSYVDSQLSSNAVYFQNIENTQNTNITNVGTYAQAAYNQANTDYTNVSVTAGSYGGTTAIPVLTVAANGRISGVTTSSITAGATITDDITTNATRYIMLGTATSGSYLVANTSSSKLQFNPSTGTLTANAFSGSANASNLYGTIPSGILGNSSVYIGTTSVTLNRSSASQSLTGVSIDGNAGTVTNGVYTSGSYADPSWITSISGSKVSGNITGNAGTVTNGVYTSGSYADPSWITSLSANKISGSVASANTVTNGFYTTSTFYLGTTSVAVNRASGSQSLTGVSIDGSAGSATTATTATTANALNTSNNYQVNSLGVGTAGSGTAGEIRATNNITAYYSDERLKNKLGNIESALDKVMTLNGFYYEANETAQSLGYAVKKEVGVSAQEVQKVLPEIVVPAPIDEKYLTVHYERLVPLLIEAIKELKQEIDDMKK